MRGAPFAAGERIADEGPVADEGPIAAPHYFFSIIALFDQNVLHICFILFCFFVLSGGEGETPHYGHCGEEMTPSAALRMGAGFAQGENCRFR